MGCRRHLIDSLHIGHGAMSASDLAAWAVGVVTVLGGLATYTQFMIKHYLSELKPNSGSSIKDQVSRLEARVDTIIELLGK